MNSESFVRVTNLGRGTAAESHYLVVITGIRRFRLLLWQSLEQFCSPRQLSGYFPRRIRRASYAEDFNSQAERRCISTVLVTASGFKSRNGYTTTFAGTEPFLGLQECNTKHHHSEGVANHHWLPDFVMPATLTLYPILHGICKRDVAPSYESLHPAKYLLCSPQFSCNTLNRNVRAFSLLPCSIVILDAAT